MVTNDQQEESLLIKEVRVLTKDEEKSFLGTTYDATGKEEQEKGNVKFRIFTLPKFGSLKGILTLIVSSVILFLLFLFGWIFLVGFLIVSVVFGIFSAIKKA